MNNPRKTKLKHDIELVLRQLVVERDMTDVPGILEQVAKAASNIQKLVLDYETKGEEVRVGEHE